MAISPNLRGALFMAISMAGFTMNDAISKFVGESLTMAQIMFIRGGFATMLVGAIAWHRGALRLPAGALDLMIVLRVGGEVLATLCFLTALAHLPLANVSAILQALPLGVTMGAALFFSEPVGWRRWLAIGVGFSGVLIIVRPGLDGFNAYSLYVLGCVFFCVVRDLATKRVNAEIPSLFITTATAAAVTVAGGALIVPYGGWHPVGANDALLLLGAAALVVIGYQFIIMAMRIGDISYIAPFRYTALLWAILLGYLVFGNVPDTAMTIGAFVVIASGLYTLYREQIVGRTRPVTSSTAPGMAPDGL
ncbi:DMT family transporter [Aquibium sp. ELW1220]|uniref:DMT family transporter n=1 Tax=Aquibium sp. ELW1220 TaxID=2976766 RepID=UPI0025B08094|nr:DMT family transporter [Aquibium sp. ELW1220]MDN2582390.1 DMT family transporter [Aquibium sp. ELW1220]